MQTERRIWIDVTDFLRWQGAFTGFQRIQYNIAKQYLADERNVGFFVYEEAERRFREVAFDPDQVAQNGIIGVEAGSEVPAGGLSRRRVLSALKRRTPAGIKRMVKKAMGVDAHIAVAPAVATGPKSPFAKADVVVVLGGIWHGSFATDIASEKHKKGFVFVHIVHDMIPVCVPAYVVEDLPGVFGAYKDIVFREADGLIINSQSSQRDANAFMKDRGIKRPKEFVFRIADELLTEKPTPRAGVSGQFILSVGTIEVRKNHGLLYYAYKQAVREGIKLPKLVLAGRNGWLTEDLRYMITHDPDTKDSILIHNGVTDGELAWLFQHCLFTIWPSFYEGWGMPVAESMAYGKVCLSSDASSMPEIAPGLIEFFSPFDSRQCLDAIVKFLDKPTRQKREAAIQKQYHTTSWRDMYKGISGFIDTL